MKQLFYKLCFLTFCLNVFDVNPALGQKVGFDDSISPDKIYGKIRSQHTTSLSSEIPTRIEKLLVREGNSFKKGSILIKLDCSLIKARYEKLEAILKAAKAKLSIETRSVSYTHLTLPTKA